MRWDLPAAEQFSLLLRSLRSADRFAVGRRLLSVVALGALADRSEPGAWRKLRVFLHTNALNEAREALLELARIVEADEPRLQQVFTEVLVNDAVHSRSLAETLSGALVILSDIGAGVDRAAFGEWFNEALEEVASGGPAIGDLATSPVVSHLLVGLAEVQEGSSVYDPCSGLSGLLALVHRQEPSVKLLGRDIHPISWAFGVLRLYLLGAEAKIELGDSLEHPPSQYDRVICDPPSGPYPERRQPLLSHTHPFSGSRRYEGLFVAHCAASLAQGGRAVVLVNQGFLARRGLDEEVRRSLAHQGLIEGIIALPAGFSPWSSADLAVLVLSDPPARREGVRMIDASLIAGWQRGRQRTAPELLEPVLEAFRNSIDSQFATTVSIERIVRSGNYRPAHYFMPVIERRSVTDLVAEAESVDALAREESAKIDALLDKLNLRNPKSERF